MLAPQGTGAHPWGVSTVEWSIPLSDDQPQPRRRRRGLAVGAALVAVAVAAGLVAVQAAKGDGSGSPEDAVQRLLDAARASDALGVLEALAPSERSALTQPLLDIEAELTRLGVLDESFDPAAVTGIGVGTGEVSLRAETLAEDLVAVHVEGPVPVSFDPVAFAFGDQSVGDLEPGTADLGEEADELVVVAVREEGGWHASLWYSVAEVARRESGESVPAFGDGTPAVGAESPEAVVKDFLGASAAGDHRRLVELVAPTEGRVLHDYGPLLLRGAEEAIEAEMTSLETTVTGDGSRRRVAIDSIAIVSTFDGEESVSTTTYSGDCVLTSIVVDDEDQYSGDSCGESGSGVWSNDVPTTSAGFGSAGLAPGLRSIDVVEEGGAWYVAPVASSASAVIANLAGVEPGALEEGLLPFLLLEPLTSVLYGPAASVYGTTTGLDGPSPDQECYGPFDDQAEDFEAVQAEERACVERLVESGTLDPSYLESYLVEDCRADIAVGTPEAEQRSTLATERACIEGLELADEYPLEVLVARECAVPVLALPADAPAEQLEPAFVAQLQCSQDADLYLDYQCQDTAYLREADSQADLRLCVQAGIAAGLLDRRVLAELECEAVYDEVTDEDYEAADEAYDECMDAAAD